MSSDLPHADLARGQTPTILGRRRCAYWRRRYRRTNPVTRVATTMPGVLTLNPDDLIAVWQS